MNFSFYNMNYSFIKYEIFTGTAFTIERDNKQFLVSCGHTFKFANHNDSIKISIFRNNIWIDLKSTIYKHKTFYYICLKW